MALLCPGKTPQRARCISVPCFSLHKHRSLCSLPSTAPLALAKGLMQGWGEASAWPFSGSCTGMDLQHLPAGPCPSRYLSLRPQPTTTLEAEQEGDGAQGDLCCCCPSCTPSVAEERVLPAGRTGEHLQTEQSSTLRTLTPENTFGR